MSREYLNRPVSTPEEIVGLIGNFGNRPDQREVQEYQVRCIKEFAVKAIQDIVLESSEYARECVEKLRAEPQTGKHIDFTEENRLNSIERDFGSDLTEEELARHFGEPIPDKKEVKSISKMSPEEVESLEKEKDNSNDIYKLSARVKNLAREGGGSLTPTGVSLCNTYTHVLKSLYDFAATLSDNDVKDKLNRLIRTHEGMAGNFIAASSAGVKARSGK